MRTILSKNLPALSEHTPLRYFCFAILYLAQGIPEGMTYFGIPAWLAMNGKSAGDIGAYVAVIGIPWTFKMLIAPLMDRFSYLPMGRRRPWIIFGQLGLLFAFIGMAMVPEPLSNFKLLMAAGFCVSLFSAFQDVAVDGMAIDIVPVHQQARANGFMWGARIMGVSASLAAGSWMLNHYGFRISILSLSAAISIILFVPLLFRERPGEKLLPWTKGVVSQNSLQLQLDSWAKIFKSMGRVLIMPYSLLIALIGFLVGTTVSYMNTLLPVFTVQALGWTNEMYSNINAVSSIVGGILGMIVGGALVDLFGKKRMLSVYLLASIAVAVMMYFSKMYWSIYWFSAGFVIVYNILYVFIMVGFLAIAMELCWKKISASQFALFMAISNFGWITGSAIIGPVKENFSWQYCILAFAFLAAIALIPLQFMNTKIHLQQLEKIDEADKTATALSL
ncbi:MAG: MFS transporter [Chitinophagaceae bacterium]|nr:MFS transporter [Chitinophagaceae bacterium]